MKTNTTLDPAACFERDGFFIMPDLITAPECDQLKGEARKVLDEHAKPGASVHLHMAHVSKLFRALAEDQRMVNLLRPLMPDGIMFLSDKIVYKAPDKTFPTPWHVDFYYWRDTRPKLSVWIPLDDATAKTAPSPWCRAVTSATGAWSKWDYRAVISNTRSATAIGRRAMW